MASIYNFNPGPAVLPPEVLAQAQAELLDYQGRGMSILEMSHRSKEYEAINAEAEARIKRLLGIEGAYRVLFLQGGASLQFTMLPMNFLPPGGIADYILTGSWSEKAYEEAARLGQVQIAASTREENYRRIPQPAEIRLSEAPVYVHLTSNNTIYGTQFADFPDLGEHALVADMSSDMLSRPFDASRFALIYAGAQKNLGPAGVTMVLLRESWLERVPRHLPSMLSYATHAKHNSLYNTPPVFALYLLNLVLGWIEQRGGLAAIAQQNRSKATLLYDAIDHSNGFYRGHAEAQSRSLMNVTFRLPDAELESRFLKQAGSSGFVGLAGHRSVGGVRASIYNAMSLEGCSALVQFMHEFLRQNG